MTEFHTVARAIRDIRNVDDQDVDEAVDMALYMVTQFAAQAREEGARQALAGAEDRKHQTGETDPIAASLDYGASLRAEIKFLNREVAALREEQRRVTATLSVARHDVIRLLDGEWAPTHATLRRALYPAEGRIQEFLGSE